MCMVVVVVVPPLLLLTKLSPSLKAFPLPSYAPDLCLPTDLPLPLRTFPSLLTFAFPRTFPSSPDLSIPPQTFPSSSDLPLLPETFSSAPDLILPPQTFPTIWTLSFLSDLPFLSRPSPAPSYLSPTLRTFFYLSRLSPTLQTFPLLPRFSLHLRPSPSSPDFPIPP